MVYLDFMKRVRNDLDLSQKQQKNNNFIKNMVRDNRLIFLVPVLVGLVSLKALNQEKQSMDQFKGKLAEHHFFAIKYIGFLYCFVKTIHGNITQIKQYRTSRQSLRDAVLTVVVATDGFSACQDKISSNTHAKNHCPYKVVPPPPSSACWLLNPFNQLDT